MAAENDFVWIHGKEKLTSYSKENGYKLNFCSYCGSPVPNKFRGFPLFSVPVGSLDGEPDIKVVVSIYSGSRAKWDKAVFEGQVFDEMPAIDEMFELLHVHV